MSIIANTVLPMKSDAIENADIEAIRVIERVIKMMEAVDWDLTLIKANEAPSTYKLCSLVTTWTNPSRMMSEPNYRAQCDVAEARFINAARDNAGAQYDAFVAKLESKIGDVIGAEITGNHVWGYSFLTVTLPTLEKQCWKTQMIVNVSKLGNMFNQFPTRKIKVKS